MPLPAPTLYPPFNIIRLSHATLGCNDLSASKAFYVDTLGMQITDEDSNTVYLRAMEERGHHSLILANGDASVRVLSFKVFAEEELDKAFDWFCAKGHNVEWVERPYQGRTLLTHDNVGIPIEFYFAMDRLETIHQKYALYKGVMPLRIDHFNCFVPNVDDSVAFWGQMGFRVTEYTEDEASGRLWAAWMQRLSLIHI